MEPLRPLPTTLLRPIRLVERLGIDLTVATETFQHTGSFKFRAGYNLAASIPHPHIVTASSGNFGQAIACACRLFGKRCTVVMPDNSAAVKVDAVRSWGATVDLIDTTRVSRAARVTELAAEYPDAYVASAFDDPHVITGNATLGTELAALDVDVIVAPVGGGGLTSGLLTGLRKAGSQTEVIGAEPLLANDAARSFRAGQLVKDVSEAQTLADGARTLGLGDRNWAILREGLARIVEVPEERIVEALRLAFSLANLKVEPTGALGLAAVLTDPDRFRGKRICCVVSGGNVDPALYAKLIA